MTVNIDEEACTGCGVCAEVCIQGLIAPPEGGTPPRIPDEECIDCGQCEAFCPTGALVRRPDGMERAVPAIDPAVLGQYMKSRRSVRQYLPEPVPRETIEAVLEIARYAASAGNGQPVEWLVIHDPGQVRTVAGLVVDWMRGLAGSDHPMSAYVPHLVAAWDNGVDVICRGAPHLLVPHVPEGNPMASTDAIIALTHVDVAAPAFGLGTCWAGFVAMSREYAPLREFYGLPEGRVPAYAMMFGYPRYRPQQVPGRKPLRVTWRGERR